MTESISTRRLSKVARELNVGISTIVDFLSDKGHEIDTNPNTKIDDKLYNVLCDEFQSEKTDKEKSQAVKFNKYTRESISIENDKKASEEIEQEKPEPEEEVIIKNLQHVREKSEEIKEEKVPEVTQNEDLAKPLIEDKKVKVIGKIDLENLGKKKNALKQTTQEKPKEEKKPEAPKEEEPIKEEKSVDKVEELKPVEAVETKTEIPVEVSTPEVKPKSAEAIEEQPKNETKQEESSKKIEAKAAVEKPTAEPESTNVPKADESTPPVASASNEDDVYKTKYTKLEGPTILGKIELPVKADKKKPVASSASYDKEKNKKKRKRIKRPGEGGTPAATPGQNAGQPGQNAGAGSGQPRPANTGFKDRPADKKGAKRPAPFQKAELTDVQIQNQIKETLARLSGAGKSKAAKYRKQKRETVSQQMAADLEKQEEEKKTLKVTEFVSANQLAKMMDVPVTEIISTCMSLGLFVSINQRLDAETISIVAEEFGYKVEFVTVTSLETIQEIEDKPEELLDRPPIVTVMGHVDHGKTSLLDYIRKANVIAGEAGGITQHIGAYNVKLDNGKHITFLDTPGHEAFTAMRARGAKVTDVAIIVISADDSVMPQTKEAINHAQAAGVPLVFAINKVDKPGANPERIKEQLANMNILVEDWGGKYQSQEISAKSGLNVSLLMDKLLLEAELLELKANPNRNGQGTIIESQLDKGRGYVSTVLVQKGTLKMGDIVLAGSFSGRVKALFNERGIPIKEAGPSMPAQLLGLNGAPQAGDLFYVMSDEREAREIASKRAQLQREQGIRTQKHITLDEIGRRLAIGDFKELNIIVKGDVDGSIEALTDSLLKLSTDKVQVNIIHKSVGAITESDVLLASASNAIVIGFQVRPSPGARKLAENEEIDIRLYSIIYDAINEVKAAMEGMLAPEFEEKITCNIEVRDVFKISKVGTIAGCMVLDGKVTRNTKIRIIRDGIVVHTGSLGSLKRFKDDVKEVSTGYECGLNIDNFNDIKTGDIVEGYEMVELKRKL
jgi:translation initiation factor IF-2